MGSETLGSLWGVGGLVGPSPGAQGSLQALLPLSPSPFLGSGSGSPSPAPGSGASSEVRRAWLVARPQAHTRGIYLPIPKHSDALYQCSVLAECSDGVLRTGRVVSVGGSVGGGGKVLVCTLGSVRAWVMKGGEEGEGEGEEEEEEGMVGDEEGEGGGGGGGGERRAGEKGGVAAMAAAAAAAAAAARPHRFSIEEKSVPPLAFPVKMLFDCCGVRGLHLRKSLSA